MGMENLFQNNKWIKLNFKRKRKKRRERMLVVGGFLPLPPSPTASVPQLSLWNDRMSLSISSHDTDDHKPGESLVPKPRDLS